MRVNVRLALGAIALSCLALTLWLLRAPSSGNAPARIMDSVASPPRRDQSSIARSTIALPPVAANARLDLNVALGAQPDDGGLSLIVVNESQCALAGAAIFEDTGARVIPSEMSLVTTTDEAGEAYIPHSRSTLLHRLGVYKDGYLPQSVSVHLGETPHRVVLREGGEVDVSLSTSTQNAVVGAIVRLSQLALEVEESEEVLPHLGSCLPGLDPRTAIYTATTDKDGRCSFRGLSNGLYQLFLPDWAMVVGGDPLADIAVSGRRAVNIELLELKGYSMRFTGDSVVTQKGSGMAASGDPVARRYATRAAARARFKYGPALYCYGVLPPSGPQSLLFEVLLADGSTRSFERTPLRLDALGAPEEVTISGLPIAADYSRVRFVVIGQDGAPLAEAPTINLQSGPEGIRFGPSKRRAWFAMAPNTTQVLPKGIYTVERSGTLYSHSTLGDSLAIRDDRMDITVQLQSTLSASRLVFTDDGEIFTPVQFRVTLLGSTIGAAPIVIQDSPSGLARRLEAGSYVCKYTVPGFVPGEQAIQISTDVANEHIYRLPLQRR